MVIAEYRVEYKLGDTWKLKPLFDIHCGAATCDLNELRKDLKESDSKTLFIGGGDVLDSIIVTDKRYRKSGDSTLGEAIIDEQIDILYQILKPYASKIIGLGEGNHEDTIIKRCGTNPIQRLCDKLATPKHKILYLGYSCLLKLIFTNNGAGARSVIIRQHHGWGGGSRTRGADITKYERDMGKWIADIFLFGHVHKKQVDRLPRLAMRGTKLVARPQLLVLCGTYKKSYTTNSITTWEETKGYPPSEIGCVTIFIKPDSHKWVKLSAIT